MYFGIFTRFNLASNIDTNVPSDPTIILERLTFSLFSIRSKLYPPTLLKILGKCNWTCCEAFEEISKISLYIFPSNESRDNLFSKFSGGISEKLICSPFDSTVFNPRIWSTVLPYIIECEPTVKSREETLLDTQEITGATVIHPYNDYRVMSGQGTIALEMIEKIHDLDIILFPIGGGGLISGNAIALNSISPKISVMGAEPDLANDAQQSLNKKELIPSIYPATIADGLRTSLGSKTFPIILQYIEEIITASEDSIIPTMKWMREKFNDKVEPSCAVPLAALMENKSFFTHKKVAIVISGGNIANT